MNLEEIKEIYADKSGRLFEACHSGELIDMGARLIAEIERLREYSAEYVQQRDECGIAQKTLNLDYLYQRRHRKWALKKGRWNAAYLLAACKMGLQRAEKAEAELARLQGETWCAYCGAGFSLDVEAEKIGEHIRTCEKHPMRKLEDDNRRLQERVRELFDGLWDAGKYLAGLGENIEAEKAFEALQHKEGE